MNGIIGMADFLTKTELNEKQLDYVQTIRKSSDSLLNIINDVFRHVKNRSLQDGIKIISF